MLPDGLTIVRISDANEIIKTSDQEMESLLLWISPLEEQRKHQKIASKRLPNTGCWFLDTKTFRTWHDEDQGPSLLGCYGIPGAGKSIIR